MGRCWHAGCTRAPITAHLWYRPHTQIWKLESAPVVNPTSGLQDAAATGTKTPAGHFLVFFAAACLKANKCDYVEPSRPVWTSWMRHCQRFLPAVIAARSRSETSTLGSHMDIVYSTSLGVGGARRSVICPAYLPAKGRCFTQPEGEESEDGVSYICRLCLFSRSADWAVNLWQQEPVGFEMEKLKVIREKKAALPKITT